MSYYTINSFQARAVDPLLTQAEVCEALRLSLSSLGRMRKDGTGPDWVRVGGSIRYRKSAVIEFIEQGETGRKSEAFPSRSA